ncbi:MAG: hypothetical protein Q9M41_05955 [Paracoccaceae bacterium]|nr:hypothetical protein [Paracoccaceae bacterium]
MIKRYGKVNIVTGLWVMAFFMIYGFLLIYLRDFAPGKEQWIAGYANGAHFESRLAHVHGNLFSLLNILFGLVLLNLKIPAGFAKWASWLALGGLLMPLGILSEVYLGLAPVLVIVGGISVFAATVVLAIGVGKTEEVA